MVVGDRVIFREWANTHSQDEYEWFTNDTLPFKIMENQTCLTLVGEVEIVDDLYAQFMMEATEGNCTAVDV
jgi:hypothetical protein